MLTNFQLKIVIDKKDTRVFMSEH